MHRLVARPAVRLAAVDDHHDVGPAPRDVVGRRELQLVRPRGPVAEVVADGRGHRCPPAVVGVEDLLVLVEDRRQRRAGQRRLAPVGDDGRDIDRRAVAAVVGAQRHVRGVRQRVVDQAGVHLVELVADRALGPLPAAVHHDERRLGRVAACARLEPHGLPAPQALVELVEVVLDEHDRPVGARIAIGEGVDHRTGGRADPSGLAAELLEDHETVLLRLCQGSGRRGRQAERRAQCREQAAHGHRGHPSAHVVLLELGLSSDPRRPARPARTAVPARQTASVLLGADRCQHRFWRKPPDRAPRGVAPGRRGVLSISLRSFNPSPFCSRPVLGRLRGKDCHMRPYEATLVLQPLLDNDGVNGVVERVTQLLTGKGGSIDLAGQLADRRGNVAEATDGWRKRRLAYAIQNHREGYYVVLRFHAPTDALADLDRALKLNDDVLRFLVLRTDA
ncbi:MAG: 30S ribosomal protein S6 [Chloroflexi bacterium CFX6]|nr:30S ribosomal protein S6 [Chloroflexi bacterium CFX6]